MSNKPVTFKFVLKGEVVLNTIRYFTETGEVLEIDEVRKILVPSKKNQQTPMVSSAGKGYLLPSEQYRKWKDQHDSVFRDWSIQLESKGVSLPIARFKIKMLFYFPDIKRRDLLNKALTIEDMLKEHGLILDDSFTVVNDYTIKGWVNREKPRTEIYITLIDYYSIEHPVDITPISYTINQKQKKAIQKRIQRLKKSKGI